MIAASFGGEAGADTVRSRTSMNSERLRRRIRLAARLAALVVLALSAVDRAAAQDAPTTASAPAGFTAPDELLEKAKALLAAAKEAQNAGNNATARAKAAEGIELLVAEDPGKDDAARMDALNRSSLIASTGGDLKSARRGWARVVEFRTRTLSPESLDLQKARLNLAAMMKELGDLPGARALENQVLEIFTRTLSPDDPALQWARGNLAATMRALGDLPRARTLQEQVLEAFVRTLPPDDARLQMARGNLAATLFSVGDVRGARTLFEQVIEVYSRTLPPEDPDLQWARGNLAATMRALGDLPGARQLFEQILEASIRTLPPDHPDVLATRFNLATTMVDLGDASGARAQFEQILQVWSRDLPPDHPDLQSVRGNLALTMQLLGDLDGARALQERILDVRTRTLPPEHPDLQRARLNLAATIAHASAEVDSEGNAQREHGRTRCVELSRDLAHAQTQAARAATASGSTREAEERNSWLAKQLDPVLSFARGCGVFAPSAELDTSAFVLSEITRGRALAEAKLRQRIVESKHVGDLRAALTSATSDFAALARRDGTTTTEYDAARAERDLAERALLDAARDAAGGSLGLIEFTDEALAARLGDGTVAVAWRRYTDWRIEVAKTDGSKASTRDVPTARLGAFVIRGRGNAGTDPTPRPAFVDLGPLDAIERAVDLRRDALGVEGTRGGAVPTATLDFDRTSNDALRALIFDPLLPAIGDARHLIVVLDDVLHALPLDALPLADGSGLFGDRYRIDVRATLTELLDVTPTPATGGLLALGGITFDGDLADPHPAVASILRGGPNEKGFEPLPYTGDEVRGIGALFDEVGGGSARSVVLDKSKASRAALVELAPKARFLHIATHGWFAPESIRSWADPEPLDAKLGLDLRMSAEERVRGMSPMLLCGLALAGANLPEDAVGHAPGLITAEEIAALDLSNCELAVLSACDTNIGVRRAGQGVASLQRALQMAGARSVITSLWRVRDEPTKELMLDFYRRLWVEKKPKHQALWEAKRKLRDAKDADGKPLYTARDWAAWVLTGDPE